MANPSQLYLLADHIKLSLLERQRAVSLNLEPSSQDGHISRSLDQMREGVEAIEHDQDDAESTGDISRSTDLKDTATRLRSQYDALTSQFQGFPNPPAKSTNTAAILNSPNDPSLSPDFARAQDPRPRIPSASSFRRSQGPSSPALSKSVRFRDTPSDSAKAAVDAANRAALFPYRDDPSNPPPGSLDPPPHPDLSNSQLHAYHTDIIAQQDSALDRLGESISRQRDLSIQIGSELDDHIDMLDEVDGHIDRHQTRLDGARKQLGNVARRARDNKQLTIIIILVIILLLLIIILKS